MPTAGAREEKPGPPPAPEPVRVRRMVRRDVPSVARLERASFSTPWSEKTFRTLLDRPGAELWVAELTPEGVIGYYVLWCIQDQGELANIAVSAAHRGRGIGGVLLDHALEVARNRGVESLYLEVRVSNDQASALYASRGFQQIGVRRDYYDRPREDARLLLLRL